MARVLIAFDKFKDALTARQACEAAARGIREIHPDWTLDLCPLTDGGEGFGETLTHAAGGRLAEEPCSDPLGRVHRASIGYLNSNQLAPPIRARLQLAPNTVLAVVEMAAASGLGLLAPLERDPWHTSSRGTGELIAAAARAGASAILLGVGGSATNDLGLGALAALGMRFLDVQGEVVDHLVPASWERIVRLEGRTKLPPLFIACDVTNPLLGPSGATATFGPQKGLRNQDGPRLERQMARLAAMLTTACAQPPGLADAPGAGAAGGIAFGLMVAAKAELVPGFDLVSTWLNLPARLAAADLVLTGEGRFDTTSLRGKGPGSLVMAARRLGKPTHVFAGRLDLAPDAPDLNGASAHVITPSELPLSVALSHAAELLQTAVTRNLD